MVLSLRIFYFPCINFPVSRVGSVKKGAFRSQRGQVEFHLLQDCFYKSPHRGFLSSALALYRGTFLLFDVTTAHELPVWFVHGLNPHHRLGGWHRSYAKAHNDDG